MLEWEEEYFVNWFMLEGDGCGLIYFGGVAVIGLEVYSF